MHSQASISYIGNFNVLSYQEETSIFCERPEGTKGCCRRWHSLFRAAHRQLFPCLAFHSRKSRSTGLGLDQSFKDDIARFEPPAVCRGCFPVVYRGGAQSSWCTRILSPCRARNSLAQFREPAEGQSVQNCDLLTFCSVVEQASCGAPMNYPGGVNVNSEVLRSYNLDCPPEARCE